MVKLDSAELQRRLLRALDVGGNTHTPADVALAVHEGRMQAWTHDDSLIVTQVDQFPRCNRLNTVLAVGRINDLVAMGSDIYAFGREHDCSAIRMEGRLGWASVLPRYGWKQTNKVIFERAL